MERTPAAYPQQTQVWRADHDEVKRQTFSEQDVKKLKGKEIRVGDAYTRIAYGAFKNITKVKRIVLSENIAYIGDEAFRGCTMLNTINLPAKLRRIGKGAFYNCCRLKTIIIPPTVKRIEPKTFKQCRGMKAISLHDQIEAIGDSAFLECESLEEIRIPEQCREIGFRSFCYCDSLKSACFPEGLLRIGREAFYRSGLTSLKLNEQLEVLEEGAFLRCLGLREITIPKSVKQIDKWAFHGCDNLHWAVFEGDPEILGSGIFNRLDTTVVCKKGSRVDRYCRGNGFTVENQSDVS
ncbi:leucine-rich repeat domain-containing protein [Acetobacterium carbinolicum]|uniref:leucine-rich repeat domain-containing protein n=1 Tax=Acetobacterium carbinolicum TaxID=52690 RepID=UPI0039C98603